MTETDLSPVEAIKENSRGLRGTLVESLSDAETGSIAEDDTQVSKFHGIYQQDDRDIRDQRHQQKLEPLYSFMIRVRVAGGVLQTKQWLALHDIAHQYANVSLRLTTRQAIQFHGVSKKSLRPAIKAISAQLLDTISACGDVNRNVMCTPTSPYHEAYRSAQKTSEAISRHLTPVSRAWHEIWLDDIKVVDSREEEERSEVEPIYGRTYLPRKFKIAIAIPPTNDVDVFAHDIGLIAIVEDGDVVGYDIAVGGGMGMSHGVRESYPRTGSIIGSCRYFQAVDVCEKIVTIQRDYGNRSDRKRARLKYTIDDNGLDWFRKELESRLGYELQLAHEIEFKRRGDSFDWIRDDHDQAHLGLWISNGRLRDQPGELALKALAEVARRHSGEFRVTPNQNLIIANIEDSHRDEFVRILSGGGLSGTGHVDNSTQLQAMACVALPTCSLAMAEAERYLPEFTDTLVRIQQRHGVAEVPIAVRITGCPNGCTRPWLSELALVGKAPGRYNLYVGGDALGQRLNRLLIENRSTAEIFDKLDELIRQFAESRNPNEHFGDYVIRAGIVDSDRTAVGFHQPMLST